MKREGRSQGEMPGTPLGRNLRGRLFAGARRCVDCLRVSRDVGGELAELTGHEPTVDQVNQWALVLASRGIPYRLSRHGRLGRLSVSRRFHASAIETILAEPHDGTLPPERESARVGGGDPRATLAVLLGLLAFHGLTQGWWLRVLPPEAWLAAGEISAQAVWARHEWYRILTALTLHAGSLHLFSNLLFGAIVMIVLCRRTGTGLGWLAAALAGAAGNAAMLFLRQESYESVGFSTAIFGGMGVLCALEMALFRSQGVRALLVPLAVGGAWLGLLGGAPAPPDEGILFTPLPEPPGPAVDVGAHCTGFLAGLPVGLLAGWYLRRRGVPSFRASCVLGGGVLACVALAWARALWVFLEG